MKIDWRGWRRPAIFNLIQKFGNVLEKEMQRTFNLGVGLTIIVRKADVPRAMACLKKLGEQPFIIGHIER